MDKYTDDELIDLLFDKSKSEMAFNVLIQKYKKPIYWHIRRMVICHEDADDLTQETFVKVWRYLENFKRESKLFTWIYRIATNESISFLNKKKKFFIFSFHDVEEHLVNTLEDDNFFKGDAIELKLQKAILSLPQKQRLVFNMKYYENLKYEEMSEILKTSTGALKASYHIAVKKIEKLINEH